METREDIWSFARREQLEDEKIYLAEGLIEYVSLINGTYFGRSRRNPKIINFAGYVDLVRLAILDDFYFSIR